MKLYTKNYYRLAVGTFFFMMGLIFSSWASRIPDIKSTLGLSEGGLSGVLLFMPLGQLSALTFAGRAIDKYGSKFFTMLASVVFSCALLCIGLSSTVMMLSGAVYLFGMGSNMFNIGVNTQGVGVQKLYGRSIMATFHGLWSLAGFCAGFIGSFMANSGIKPLYHYIIIVSICMIILLVAHRWLMPRDKSRKDFLVQEFEQTKPKKKVKFAMPERIILLLGMIVFGNLAAEGTMFDWSGVYFDTVIKPDPRYVRVGYIAALSTMATGRFLADRLISRFGSITILVASGVLASAGFLLAVLVPKLIPATLGFMMVGFGISSVVPICYSIAGRLKSVSAGVALTTVSSIGFFGFLLAPPLVGFVAELSSLRLSLLIIGVVAIVSAVLAPQLKKEKVEL